MIKEKTATAVVRTEHEKISSILYWCSYKLPSNVCEGRSDKVSYNLNLTIAAGAFRCCPYVFRTVDMLKRYKDANLLIRGKVEQTTIISQNVCEKSHA